MTNYAVCQRFLMLNKAHFTGFYNLKKVLTNVSLFRIITLAVADVAELADAHGSGPCESNFMGVQVPSSAPKEQYPFGYCSFLLV